MLLFQSFFHQPIFQHISDFHVICFGKGEMAVAAYADVGQAHNAGIAAVAVDTVGEGLRHMDALNPTLWCPVRVVCRNIIAALEAEQADLNTQLSDPEIFKDYEKAGHLQARGGNRNAAAGKIGAVGNAGREAERGGGNLGFR